MSSPPLSMPMGCKPPTRLDTAPSLKLFRAIAERKAPAVLDRSKIIYPTSMYDNDKYGNCTSAAVANTMNIIATLNGFALQIDNTDVDAFYALCTGWNPTIPGTDNGADPTLVLCKLATQGFTLGHAGKYKYVYYGNFGTVDTTDRNAMANTIDIMGSLYGAFGMAEADSLTAAGNGTFDINTPGNQTPWSWGGHLMCIYDYTGLSDTDTVRLSTWGGLRRATWRWVESRLAAAYGIAFRQLLTTQGLSHLGENWATLQSEVSSFVKTI